MNMLTIILIILIVLLLKKNSTTNYSKPYIAKKIDNTTNEEQFWITQAQNNKLFNIQASNQKLQTSYTNTKDNNLDSIFKSEPKPSNIKEGPKNVPKNNKLVVPVGPNVPKNNKLVVPVGPKNRYLDLNKPINQISKGNMNLGI